MADARKLPFKVDPDRFYILSPVLPFLDVIFQSGNITEKDFGKIVALAGKFPEDPRMVEVVTKCGDASAKVPYLLNDDETPETVLATLRGIAEPHIEYLNHLPENLQVTIRLLLSINALPRGYERYGIPALLELDRMQGEIVGALRRFMKDRRLAKMFHENNQKALRVLDREWPRIREERTSRFSPFRLPEHSTMQYEPFFDKEKRLQYIQETCVIVDSPNAKVLREFTPRVLQDPLPFNEPVPEIGSADWFIRRVGKVGHHLTRALLGIISEQLAAEHISVEKENYDVINRQALLALQNYIEKMP
jgi:hypothetical protein